MIHRLLVDPTVDHVRALTMWCIVLSVTLLVVLGLTSWNTIRTRNDEHTICEIQAAWLPAGHQIASALNDLEVLVVKPRSSRGRDLVASVARYDVGESHVPQELDC